MPKLIEEDVGQATEGAKAKTKWPNVTELKAMYAGEDGHHQAMKFVLRRSVYEAIVDKEVSWADFCKARLAYQLESIKRKTEAVKEACKKAIEEGEPTSHAKPLAYDTPEDLERAEKAAAAIEARRQKILEQVKLAKANLAKAKK